MKNCSNILQYFEIRELSSLNKCRQRIIENIIVILKIRFCSVGQGPNKHELDNVHGVNSRLRISPPEGKVYKSQVSTERKIMQDMVKFAFPSLLILLNTLL